MPCKFDIENYGKWSTKTVGEIQRDSKTGETICLGGITVLADPAYDPRNGTVSFLTPTTGTLGCQEDLTVDQCMSTHMKTTFNNLSSKCAWYDIPCWLPAGATDNPDDPMVPYCRDDNGKCYASTHDCKIPCAPDA